MFETIFIFIMKCVWACIYIMFLIAPIILIVWLTIAAIHDFRQMKKRNDKEKLYQLKQHK